MSDLIERRAAIDVLRNELKCVLRKDCDRVVCKTCDLLMNEADVVEALTMAIDVLSAQPEKEQKSCENWHDVPSDEMTVEQARQAVKDLRKKLAEYLEQEPCKDCISRSEAIDALHMHLMYRMGTDSNKKRLDEWINNLPSAQPERKKGHWIEVDDNRISGRCSLCGWEAHLYEDDVIGMNYCPNCGADMRGEKDG